MPDEKRQYPEENAGSRSGYDEIDWTHYGREAESIRDGVREAGGPSEEPVPDPDSPPEPSSEPSELTWETEDGQTAPDEPAEGEGWPMAEQEEDWPEPEMAEDGPYEAYDSYRDGSAPPPEDPPRAARRAPRRRRRSSMGVTVLVAMLYVVSVLAIAFVMATLGWRWANDLLALNKTEHTASVVIEAGESVEDVAQSLHEEGLIDYPVLFQIFAAFTGKAEAISSGTYELNTTMDYSALLNNISASSSARETVTVTIPEGYTVEEIFALLETQGVCTVEELEEAAMTEEYDYSFLQGLEQDDPYWMEGYLFPDTYEFYVDGDAHVALSRMLYNYSQKFDSEMRTRAERLGYTQHEIMIVASIIEEETDGSDQRDIASVIYNRLETDGETDGYLQMDSTIQFILEERKEELTAEDLAIDSPYNTYLYPGLPEGPISNPGMEAIQAALYPNSTTYYYFILGNDGQTHFFSTGEEFMQFRDLVESGQDVAAEEDETADE
ncbi:MAG TPA: endolytic transglycosylase MltG [Candidatus Onthomonas avicola]|nr:endolytic transglycosylase MltG [Candidatus Onthomonas avicola]